MKTEGQAQVTRRQFMTGGALLASAATLGFTGIFGLKSARAAEGDDVQTIINVAATAEAFACTHYYRALKSKIKFTTPQHDYIKAALEEELIHLEYLKANGAKALISTFFFPTITFSSAIAFGNVSAV